MVCVVAGLDVLAKKKQAEQQQQRHGVGRTAYTYLKEVCLVLCGNNSKFRLLLLQMFCTCLGLRIRLVKFHALLLRMCLSCPICLQQ